MKCLLGLCRSALGVGGRVLGKCLARLFESRAAIDDDCLPCEPATLSRVA